MTDRRPSPEDSAFEARLALRKAEREADGDAERLRRRLNHVEIHQREARYLLERAGLLSRRAARNGETS
jgi:hypothetical protein